MHTQALTQRSADADARERDQAIRLANIAGVADPEERVTPDMPATIRYGDPNLAALFEKEARVELVEEALTKLEALELKGDAPNTSLRDIDGIGPDIEAELNQAGIYTPEDLNGANDADLLKIDGIGKANLKKIRSQL